MGKYEEVKEGILKGVGESLQELIALNDDLADHPEISGEEYESSRKIVELLRGKGFEVEYPFAGLDTAFKGVFGSNDHKYKVAILAEYDALPEIGHACGHCVSGSISILAAIALSKLQDALDTDVHIIGTPIEETDGAKCGMVKNGVFDQYDMAMMIHLYDQNLLYCTLLALDSFFIYLPREGGSCGSAALGWRKCVKCGAADVPCGGHAAAARNAGCSASWNFSQRRCGAEYCSGRGQR